MFRGKESSNRIELSRLVQELSNFGVFGFLQLLGAGGGWGMPPTHVHMHAHARTCMHGKHGNFMQMATPIGFGEIPGIPYDVIRTCVHVHVCASGWGAPSNHPHPHSLNPNPPGGTPRIIQNSNYLINLDIMEIIQYCLKIYNLLRHPHLWRDVWVDGWVNMWVNGWDQVISLKIK